MNEASKSHNLSQSIYHTLNSKRRIQKKSKVNIKHLSNSVVRDESDFNLSPPSSRNNNY